MTTRNTGGGGTWQWEIDWGVDGDMWHWESKVGGQGGLRTAQREWSMDGNTWHSESEGRHMALGEWW